MGWGIQLEAASKGPYGAPDALCHLVTGAHLPRCLELTSPSFAFACRLVPWAMELWEFWPGPQAGHAGPAWCCWPDGRECRQQRTELDEE